MITYDKEKLSIANRWKDNSIYVLTDFDRTITSPNSYVSWDILSNNDLVSNEYILEVKELYNHFRPLEIDERINLETKNKLMLNWWNEEVRLLIKYKLDENIIKQASKNMNLITFRDGAKDFLINMKNRNIPVIILSAGIGNFIEQFLTFNDYYSDNIFVLSNFLKFENGIAVGFSGDVIHSLNKNVVSLPNNIKELIKYRNNIILFGDSVGDIKMIKEKDINNALKIGFLEEKVDYNRKYFDNNFDVVCTNNTSFDDLSKKVKVLKR